MRSNLWLTIGAIAVALLACKEASAQGCSVSYDPSFSLWENVSADATNIYTQVGIDGSGTMTVEGMCDLPSISHSAYIWNSVGSVGNSWVPTGEFCPDCYVSTEQDDIVPYDPTQAYSFDFEGQMWCNIGGEFFDTGGYIGIKIAITTYLIQTVNLDGTVTFIQACPGTSVPSCGATYLTGTEPTIWAEEYQLGITIGGSQPLCSPVSIIQYFNGPPAPFLCQ